MWLVTLDPVNFIGTAEFTQTISKEHNIEEAREYAKKLSAMYDKAYIFKLQEYVVIEKITTNGYKINDKGEVIPC